MRILTLVGARPQFIKASMVSRAFLASGIEEILIHSGQHYDKRVSQIFFDELGIPKPYINLHVGSASHAVQTAEIMSRLDDELSRIDSIDSLLVYGDTNTTLAGALVAVKRGIPVAHIEAGLRSFNRTMPEELNRIITDKVSSLLFCPTETAIQNLSKEGITDGVFFSGDVMYDATLHFLSIAEAKIAQPYKSGEYYLSTIHRASNTDNMKNLVAILDGFSKLELPVVFPVHPRTKPRLETIKIPENVILREPASYLQILQLVRHARAVMTDSGGLQKEAYWLKTPCITLREETEWIETLFGGWNQLVGADSDLLVESVANIPLPGDKQWVFGLPEVGESASTYIVHQIKENLTK